MIFSLVTVNSVNTIENEALESKANVHHEDFETIVDSASQNQVIGSNADDRIRNSVDSAAIAVENLMHDAILTAMTIWLFRELRWL